MSKQVIYPKDWMEIHPYTLIQPSDAYFVGLANKLYAVCALDELPLLFRKKMCLYIAAYLEDVISGLGCWKGFVREHTRLYGKPLPFYPVSSDYQSDEVNEEDICFLIWNTWEKALYKHAYINPEDERIKKQAATFYRILAEAYEEAPENPLLEGYFDSFADEKEAGRKLAWLFGHSYLTEPSMQPYIANVTPSDRFIVPVGPLALFLSEWIELLAGENTQVWKSVKGLFQPEVAVPAKVCGKNVATYQLFVDATGGCPVVYLNGYDALRRFLVEKLKWADDDSHTLPQMKAHRNFILMANPEKGILLAKDICEYIADSANPMYNSVLASQHAFRLLTEETLCPPDLLLYVLRENLLPDVAFPDGKGHELIRQNADFIARHALLYYYRGD